MLCATDVHMGDEGRIVARISDHRDEGRSVLTLRFGTDFDLSLYARCSAADLVGALSGVLWAALNDLSTEDCRSAFSAAEVRLPIAAGRVATAEPF
jgi:hypothetical protein